MRASIALLVLLGFIGCVYTQGCNSAQVSSTILADEHNKYRSSVAQGLVSSVDGSKFPQATQMFQVVWDPAMQTNAQGWADTTYAGHSDATTYRKIGTEIWGENIYNVMYSNSYYADCAQIMRNAVKSWFDENIYTPTSQIAKLTSVSFNSKVIGHFTQVVKGDTKRIGCGMKSFFNSASAFPYWTRVVCQYNTPNYLNLPIYSSGSLAAACPSGVSATYAGLCK